MGFGGATTICVITTGTARYWLHQALKRINNRFHRFATWHYVIAY